MTKARHKILKCIVALIYVGMKKVSLGKMKYRELK